MQIGLKSVLTTLDSINAVALHLSSHIEAIATSVLEIMREILEVAHIGYKYESRSNVVNNNYCF